jgi:hypothetical protein
MPLLLFGLASVLGTGAWAYKTVTDETEDFVAKTGPDLIVLGLAAVALVGAYHMARKGRI